MQITEQINFDKVRGALTVAQRESLVAVKPLFLEDPGNGTAIQCAALT